MLIGDQTHRRMVVGWLAGYCLCQDRMPTFLPSPPPHVSAIGIFAYFIFFMICDVVTYDGREAK